MTPNKYIQNPAYKLYVDKYTNYVEDGKMFHFKALEVLRKLLWEYIEAGLVTVKAYLKGPVDIIIEVKGKSFILIELKHLCNSWWMSSGWLQREVISRFDNLDGIHKFLLTTFKEIWTDLDREIMKASDIRPVYVGRKSSGPDDKEFTHLLIRNLAFIKKLVSEKLFGYVRSREEYKLITIYNYLSNTNKLTNTTTKPQKPTRLERGPPRRFKSFSLNARGEWVYE